MVGETRPTSKMSVTFVAGYANLGENAQGAHLIVATHLGTDVLYHTYHFYDMHYIRIF